jgi:putative FmdB family regulatory protein
MPLYEYECETCGHRFEVIQKFSDRPIEACPKCEGRVRKLLSSPAIQFKGSGWYITDYARKGGDAASAESSNKPADAKPKEPAKPASGDTTTAAPPAPASSSKDS